jgi:hypothetical protein
MAARRRRHDGRTIHAKRTRSGDRNVRFTCGHDKLRGTDRRVQAGQIVKDSPGNDQSSPGFCGCSRGGYSHQFSIPNDATNAHLEGEFTVDPRPQGQLQLLIISTEGMQHWQRFLSSTVSPSDPANAELIYRSGDTIADRFNIKMIPGNYYVIFDYDPAAVSTADHFGGGVSGPAIRRARSQIMLNYALPCENCP